MKQSCNQLNSSSLKTNSHNKAEQYASRAQSCTNPAAQRLFHIMARKQTNLALAADVTTKRELLALADQVGPFICMLKTHIDMIQDFDHDLIEQLKALSKKHDFIIFEDRKFADIGNTVKHQYEGGMYTIAQWADLVTVHALPGPGIVEGIAHAARQYGNGIVLLPSMSSAGNLMTPEYARATVDIAHRYKDLVAGLIVRDCITTDPGFILMMPGVQIQQSSDTLGQQYVSPEQAIERGADIIIVGRGICHASDPVGAARMYCERAWHAQCEKIINACPAL